LKKVFNGKGLENFKKSLQGLKDVVDDIVGFFRKAGKGIQD
jgi:hypothetical protein